MDVAKFDRRTYFSAVDIACLICGKDPLEVTSAAEFQYELDLIKTASAEGVNYILGNVPSLDLSNSVGMPLFSRELFVYFDRKRRLYANHDDGEVLEPNPSDVRSFNFDFMNWQRGEDSHVENMKFDRVEIARWIKSCSLKPEYSFETTRGSASEIDKPLATVERRILLTIIAALCKAANVDYRQPGPASGDVIVMLDKIGCKVVGADPILTTCAD